VNFQRWVGAVLLVILCASCTSGSESPPDPAATVGIRQLLSETPADAVNFERHFEDEVALCMLARGFEYERQFTLSATFAEPRTRSYYQTWALGISTTFFNESFVDPPVSGATHMGVGAPVPADPLRELSAQEFDAYLVALEGPDGSSGCTGIAERSALDAYPSVEDFFRIEQLGDVRIDRSDLDEVILGCLREQGHDYRSTEDIFDSAQRRVEEINPGPISGTRLDVQSQTALLKVQDEERAVAVALWECGWFPENETDATRPLWQAFEERLVAAMDAS